MDSRPVLSLSERLNGRSWADQLSRTPGGSEFVQGDRPPGPCGASATINHNIPTRARDIGGRP